MNMKKFSPSLPNPLSIHFLSLRKIPTSTSFRYTKSMAQSEGSSYRKKLFFFFSFFIIHSTGKKPIQIDISADTVCPWCFVGKRNLDKAIASSKDQFDFEIRWHPFFLNSSAPKEGVSKAEYYKNKFGPRSEQVKAWTVEIIRSIGLEYDISGLTGNTLDSHRLIYFAGKQGFDKQHNLVEELCLGYFTQGKYIGDQEFLLESAKKVGVEGAAEFLQDPNNGLNEVNEDFNKYSAHVSGVPYYVINGKQQLSGGQPPEAFLRAFKAATF